MTINTESIRDAAEVLDTLTSALAVDHPLRTRATARAKSCVSGLYSAADTLDAQTAEIAGLKSQVEMLEACAAGDAALTKGQQREIALLRGLLADYDRMRDALRWAAEALQESCRATVPITEGDLFFIRSEARTAAEILDAANAALAQEGS